ncbi:MAG: cation:proton antiporter [bacterium]
MRPPDHSFPWTASARRRWLGRGSGHRPAPASLLVAATVLATLVALVAPVSSAASGGAAHADPVARVALGLVVMLWAAKLGGEIAVRLGQPAVLGELVIGIALGNLTHAGFTWPSALASDPTLDMLARIGVLILLFEVGLESTVRQMLAVGWTALVVATLGVVAPFALGWLAGAWLLPEAGPYVHAFLGATLCATSVGITARVLQDLGSSQTPEARVILGAAVIDDVLGLVVLAVVSSVIVAANGGAPVTRLAIVAIVAKAGAFLIGALVLGVALTPRAFALASRMQSRGVLLAAGLSFCFLLAWLAAAIGLAPIVGAFAAGLILESVHYRDFVSRGEQELEALVHPIASFLVPIFFVTMGMHTDLSAFADPSVLALAGALTVAAIAGKQACSLGVLGKGLDRLTIGIGMVPRGEVGLIFANIGLGLEIAGQPVVTPSVYAAMVVMVVLTTLITPPALRFSLARARTSPTERP